MESHDPVNDFNVIQNELKSYGLGLDKRPLIVVASKIDALEDDSVIKNFEKEIGQKVYQISSLTHKGIDELINKINETLSNTAQFALELNKEDEKMKVYDAHKLDKKMFEIKRVGEHEFQIVGESVERTYSLINLSTDEGIMRLINYLRRIGVEEALKENGAQSGDTVSLCDFEFEYFD